MGELLESMRAGGRAKGTRCVIAVVFDKLTPDDADDLREALADPAIAGAAIARVLTATGTKVDQGSVTRHRRGECRCEPTS